MTFKVEPRVRETSATTGVGTYARAGAVPGYQAFDSLGANNYCPYFATDGIDWEEGIGRVLTGPARLERTHVLGSSNGDAAVNWAGAGPRTLRCGWIAPLSSTRVVSKDVAGGVGTTTLTQEEQRCHVLIFTGALTGNRIVEVDADTPWSWDAIINNTTGAFTLTVRAVGQTGAEFYAGRAVAAVHDGVDVKKVGEDPAPGLEENYYGGAIAAGRLGCDGANVAIATYPALHAKIGFTHGNPGGGNFTLPDRRRKVAVGSGGTGTAQLGNAVGNTGGAESRTITTAHLPASGLSIPSLSVTTTANFHSDGHAGGGGPRPAASGGNQEAVTGSTGGGTTGNMGAGGALDEMQPGMVLLATIRT